MLRPVIGKCLYKYQLQTQAGYNQEPVSCCLWESSLCMNLTSRVELVYVHTSSKSSCVYMLYTLLQITQNLTNMFFTERSPFPKEAHGTQSKAIRWTLTPEYFISDVFHETFLSFNKRGQLLKCIAWIISHAERGPRSEGPQELENVEKPVLEYQGTRVTGSFSVCLSFILVFTPLNLPFI